MNEIGFMPRLNKDKYYESKYFIRGGQGNYTLLEFSHEIETPPKEITRKIIDLNVERHNWKKIDRSKLSLADQNELQDEEE